MNPFVILTPTYNHPEKLRILYQSLKEQTDKGFSWVVVNDGSREETVEVLKEFCDENAVDILPVHQVNGGKSRAVNNGLDHLTPEVVFVVIVDDDIKLRPDAIKTIRQYYSDYKDSNCGVVFFNLVNERGRILAKPVIQEDFTMSYQRFKSLGRRGDGCISYFTSKLGNNRFEIKDGEKYIGPSTLFMQVTENSDLLWTKAILGETEYLEGGITKQGRKLRVKNPQSMIVYCKLMLRNGASLKMRIIYSILGCAYYELIDKAKRKDIDLNGLFKFRLCGKLLAIYWKKKYQL